MKKTPRTVTEALDAASDGREFGLVLLGLFDALDRSRFDSEANTGHPEDDAE